MKRSRYFSWGRTSARFAPNNILKTENAIRKSTAGYTDLTVICVTGIKGIRERNNLVNGNRIRIFFQIVAIICGIWPTAINAQHRNDIAAGQFVVEPPTLISLGFEWYVDGDANRNASVTTTYRKPGEQGWHEGLPLLRINDEHTRYLETLNYTAPNMFAGSIFDLEPNTEYECRFVLSDPDGATGKKQEIVRVRTRAEPQPSKVGRVFHVYPDGYEGRGGRRNA